MPNRRLPNVASGIRPDDAANMFQLNELKSSLDGGVRAEAQHITDATQSTTTATGALIVDGGVGIVKDVFVGGKVSVAGTLTGTGGLIVDSGVQVGSDTPTVSKPSGIVTTAVTATAGLASKTVTITNTLVTATSKVFVSIGGYGGTGIPLVYQVTTSANTITVLIYNAHATVALSAAMDLYFFVVN